MGQLSLTLEEIGDDWPLIRLLMDDPVYEETYRDAVAETLEGPMAEDAFAARAGELHDLIAPSVEAEEAPFTQIQDPAGFASVGGDSRRFRPEPPRGGGCRARHRVARTAGVATLETG